MNGEAIRHHQQTIGSCYAVMRINVFADEYSAGTRALVCLAKGPPGQDELQAMSDLGEDSEACCWTWLDGATLQVRSYHAGTPIAFCGHGLLASAYAWRKRQWSPGTVQSATRSYSASEDDSGSLWLHCSQIATRPAREFPLTWFDCPPLAVAQAGPDDGYWILQWPPGFDIAHLKPDLAEISRSTRRAVIVTAKDGDNQVSLRYFAPQYGNPEDSVTGSACVVLADYWQRPQLVMRQRSPRGGRIETRLDTERVSISGQLAVDTIDWRASP